MNRNEEGSLAASIKGRWTKVVVEDAARRQHLHLQSAPSVWSLSSRRDKAPSSSWSTINALCS